MQLNKKTIVITGASSGIGATLAKRASLNGASVVLAARTESKLLELMQTHFVHQSNHYLDAMELL